MTTNYDVVFAPVLSSMRTDEEISIALAAGVSGGASKDVEIQVARIERLISKGDAYFKQKKYEKALKSFKKARALIYKILFPKFDVGSYVQAEKYFILPLSKSIENKIIDASIQIFDVLRPTLVKEESLLGFQNEVEIEKTLEPYTRAGFRESMNIEETMQFAGIQGISLLNDNKPGAAARLMEMALDEAKASEINIDPSLCGALELNLSSAYLQMGNHKKAQTYAFASLENFGKVKDKVGQAQAYHMGGVCVRKSGDKQRAKPLFKKASDTLKKASRDDVSDSCFTARQEASEGTKAFAAEEISSGVVSFSQQKISAVSLVSRKMEDLQGIMDMNAFALTYRLPGRADGWGTLTMYDDLQQHQYAKTWELGISSGNNNFVNYEVGAGKLLTSGQMIKDIYKPRINANRYADLNYHLVNTSSTTFYLTQLYSYVLPVKIGDTFHEMGKYKQAEKNYLQASGYTYLNKKIEASTLWNRLARNAIEWGHTLYKKEKIAAAKVQYGKIITGDATVPNSFLYNTTALSYPANDAKKIIQGILERPLPGLNMEIKINVLIAHFYFQQILNGLDFYGLAFSPIHTFEYLQGVAQGFASEAIQAEREFVNFKSREEGEEATRRDLETTLAMAEAERDARYQQYLAAQEDESAAKNAYDLVVERHSNAVTQKAAYAASSWAQIWAQAASAALGGREDAMWAEIKELADKLDRGETIHGPGPKLAAAQLLSAGRKTRKYELQKMQDTIDELAEAKTVAKDQWDAAKHRTNSSEIAWQAAKERVSMASAALEAFDDEFFTPETWGKMAHVMRDIARSYLFRAIRIAKLMERAYNFENDTNLRVIKSEYGHGVSNPEPGRDTRLLGGDSLLKDIDSFTYHAITNKIRKNSNIKDIISVSLDFPAQFEEFRRTGLLAMETDLYEFDRLHPGFYGQRIEAIEVEFIGLLPKDGLNGTLTLGGTTRYRKKNYTIARRVHQVDTMALSDYVLRNDAFVYRAETGVRGLYQGFGVGTTWKLHLPRRSNNFDFRRIFDVQLVIYYTAKFDPVLRTTVLQTPPREDELALLRNYGLRYDFPDAWYGFYHDGFTQFTLDRFRLPMNQKEFEIQAVHFRVVTKPGVSNEGIELTITGPGETSGQVTTDSSGVVSTEDASTLAFLVGTDPMGLWKIEVTGGESVTDGGTLQLDRIYNIQMGLDYKFEYVEEVI